MKHHPQHRRRQYGFNLIELMIALALGLIVMLGAGSVFLSNKQSYRTNAALGDIQENSRIAFELLARDLRQARLTGCGNLGSVSNLINNNTDAANWYADFANRGLIAFDGGGADNNPALTTGTSSGNHKTGTDNITLIGAAEASYSLKSDYVASTGLDLVESSPSLDKGDLVVVCDPSQADIAQITAVTSGKFKILTGSGSPGNSAGISYIYHGSSAVVSPLKSVTWYIGCNPVTTASCDPTLGETSLYRLTTVGVPSTGAVATQAQEMARGVAAMDLSFHRNGTDDFIDANSVTSWDSSVIDAVRMTLRFVALDTSNGNTPISREFTTIVTLRNPPKD